MQPTNERRSRLKVVGLFAGIGGIEEGLRRCDCEIAMLCENDPAAQQVSRHQFDRVPLTKDIQDLQTLPECDVVAGGFPCQDLSQAGQTHGLGGNSSGLVQNVFRLVRKMRRKPKWIILENVAFMFQLHSGRAIREIVTILERERWNWASHRARGGG